MKVLFAVSNEEISEAIVKKYQKEYKQIISYKNVYYFNAILKELQKDKSYDRVVISEDLEAFTHTQYDQIDKFIFDKLDSISDEASNSKGNDIPIIVICSDRRTKSEEMLVKLFGIGIYNAIIGNDRSVDEVCKLINRPRSKKDAKIYYKIESENVNYQSENENDVSEMEIQNILAHYKRLGKNEERYIDSFNNIAAQYNDAQLRIISKFLPLNVRAVLEEQSPKYQQIMSFNNSVSDKLRKPKSEEKHGPSETLLKPKNKEKLMSKPVVIPSSVNMNSNKKLGRLKKVDARTTAEIAQEVKNAAMHNRELEQKQSTVKAPIVENKIEETLPAEEPVIMPGLEKVEKTPEVATEPPKRRRGRPRKNPLPEESATQAAPKKRGRGRPRKNPLPEPEPEPILVEPEEPKIEEKQEKVEEASILPGLDTLQTLNQIHNQEETYISKPQETNTNDLESGFLPGLDFDFEEPENDPIANNNEPQSIGSFANSMPMNINTQPEEVIEAIETVDLTPLLTPDKKIVTFVGTSKNGTSFVVNNLAELLASSGVNVAILDTTKNRNAYYIYTKNEEALREVATHCIDDLGKGIANGIPASKNLTVYTSLPEAGEGIKNADRVLETLLKNHSLILIDTDFETPERYFEQSQETYLVQSYDILTIQPLTAFLKGLKEKNILDEKKLRVILNKAVKIRGINEKTIIGGMAFYNNPNMTLMVELFDRHLIKYITLPFEEETYIKYLQGIIECDISLKGYSKIFLQTLKELANMVYQTNGNGRGKNNYRPPSVNGGFNPSINQTLDQMKQNY